MVNFDLARRDGTNPVEKIFLTKQSTRLIQLLRISQIILFSVALIAMNVGHYSQAVILLVTGVLLFFVDYVMRYDNYRLGTSILLFTLTLALALIVWMSNGLHGVIPLGYGGILMFAAMLGDRKQLSILLIFMVMVCLSLAFGNYLGYRSDTPIPTTISTGFIMSIVLIVIGYCGYLMARDYRWAVSALAQENIQITQAKNHIEHLSLHDSLTNLPNRILARKLFPEEFLKNVKANRELAIVLIDLDNLKSINDSLGQKTGDAVLIEVANRLRTLINHNDFICRYESDEFIVFINKVSQDENVSKVCENILATLSEPYLYLNFEIICTCSIGISIAPRDGEDLDTLIKKADIALHIAKSSGRNSFHFYHSSINNTLNDHLNIISDIRKGINGKQFSLHYQPKIDLCNNQLRGFEALMRWEHPKQGFIPPITFIPLAESSGLIIQLGEWLIDEACRQAKLWVDQGFDNFAIGVNISYIQFKRGNMESIVLNTLKKYQLPAHFLELELTESLWIDNNERLVSTLSNLRNEGVHISIDDFGTGYSNLSYLRKFAVETLKIDQSFIREINTKDGESAIVKAIIQMCESLGLGSVAEGVEDADTAELLRNLGCTQGQGYYWSRPLPAPKVLEFWQQWNMKHPVTAHTPELTYSSPPPL